MSEDPPEHGVPPRLNMPPAGGDEPRRRSGWWLVGLVLLFFLAVLGFSFLQAVGDLAGSFRSAAPGLDKYREIQMRDGDTEAKIAVIKVEGVISRYSFDGTGQNMVTRVRDQFKLAKRDSSVRAVLLQVDSPGGEVMASDEIHDLIEGYTEDTGNPVICSMSGIAASGGYYVAAPCEFIVAHELTLTGSIGVIMQTVNVHGLMEKVGARPFTITSGENKDAMSIFKAPDEIEADGDEKLFDELVQFYFGRFKKIIEDGRGAAQKFNRDKKDRGRPLSADWASLADGRILSGVVAYESGFVDKLGGFDDAVAVAERIIGLTDGGTASLVRYAAPFDLSGLLRFFVKADNPELKVDLGVELPRLDPGRPYYLSPAIYR